MSPTNLNEYLIERLDRLPVVARLILVLDPGGRLSLTDELASNQLKALGHIWKILRYDGNDLAFRRQFDPAQATIVWITGPQAVVEPIQIDLTSLVDIVRRADDIIDASLIGSLHSQFPNEIWPSESIEDFADVIALHLDGFVHSYKNLKPHLDPGAALSSHSIQALVLACLQPTIHPVEFLFRVDSPVALLKEYILLAWTIDWDETGLSLLQKQASEASLLALGDLEAWFEVDIHGLAQLIYFYRSLSSARIPNIINQIRGLGLLNFDPEKLEAGLGQIMSLWEKDISWRNRLIQNAEHDLEMEAVHRATSLLCGDSTELTRNLTNTETPAFAYSLAKRLVELYTIDGRLTELLEVWSKFHPSLIDQLDESANIYSQQLKSLSSVLDELTFVQSRVISDITDISSLDSLVKWYIQGRYYDLEYAHARAAMAHVKLKEESLRNRLQTVLVQVREQLRNYLDNADQILAKLIKQNWHAYITSPILSPNVLRDYVERVRFTSTDTACLWLIVFDGMRFDTWEAVVKPQLLQAFEIKKEKAYLSLLPSWTRVARTAITAGRTPDLWRNYHNNFTYNEFLLAGRFFGLPENQYQQKLRFFSGMESDRTHVQFDRNRRYPYNILIFNISDDDLHKQRDHIGTLNENIKSAMVRILHFLDGLVQKDDTVIVTSDHGFIELDPGYAIAVKDSNKWQRYIDGSEHPVHFRFIRSNDPVNNLPEEDVLEFEWKMPDGKFAVAVGRHWFQREGSKNAVRYEHGGLSFAEMVVPGVLLQPIKEKNIDLRFEGLPEELSVDEGQTITISVTIINRGNQQGVFDLEYYLDTDRAAGKANSQIPPHGKYAIILNLDPVFNVDGKKTSRLTLNLRYLTANGKTYIRRQDISINIIERKDVVQFSLGGLDDLDL